MVLFIINQKRTSIASYTLIVNWGLYDLPVLIIRRVVATTLLRKKIFLEKTLRRTRVKWNTWIRYWSNFPNLYTKYMYGGKQTNKQTRPNQTKTNKNKKQKTNNKTKQNKAKQKNNKNKQTNKQKQKTKANKNNITTHDSKLGPSACFLIECSTKRSNGPQKSSAATNQMMPLLFCKFLKLYILFTLNWVEVGSNALIKILNLFGESYVCTVILSISTAFKRYTLHCKNCVKGLNIFLNTFLSPLCKHV